MALRKAINLGWYRGTDGKVLERILVNSARSMDMTPHEVALVMAHFLENLADELSKGRVIRLPGFGMFAPVAVEHRKQSGVMKVYPSFSPAVGLRNQVDVCCPPNKAGVIALTKHRKRHHPASRKDKVGSRVFTAMKKLRQNINADARKKGMR